MSDDHEGRHRNRQRPDRRVWADDAVRALARAWQYSAILFPLTLASGALMVVWGRPIGLLLVAVGAVLPLASRWAVRNYPHRFLGGGPITTNRLRIRSATPTTVHQYLAMLDDEFMASHHWNEQTKLASRMALVDPVLSRLASSDFALLHRLDEPETTIGFVSVGQSPDNEGRMMIGAHLLADYRGQGYMTETLEALFPELAASGVPVVHAACSLDNEAMIAVAQRAKMVRLPDVDSWTHVNGESEPAALFVWGAPSVGQAGHKSGQPRSGPNPSRT